MKCKHCGKPIYKSIGKGRWYHGNGHFGMDLCYSNAWPDDVQRATPDESYTVDKILKKYGQES